MIISFLKRGWQLGARGNLKEMRGQILQAPGREEAAHLAAEIVANRLRAFPDLCLALPTGNTPILAYKRLRQLADERSLPTRSATLVQIDEYVGAGQESEGSFYSYLQREFRGIEFAQKFSWNGGADPEEEISRAKKTFPRSLDLALLGLGANGHVAFCEPGCPVDEDFYISRLAPSTKQINKTDKDLALTMGISYLQRAREIVLLVLGKSKADILAQALQGPQTRDVPLSLLQNHRRLLVITDPEAASRLQNFTPPQSGHATIVVGCRQRNGDYSPSSSGRVLSAARTASRHNSDLLLFSGGVLRERESEAEKMAEEMPTQVLIPFLLEEAADRTSRHALLGLPLLRCLGINRITLVTSWWHMPRFWWMHRWVGRVLPARFQPAWTKPFLGLRGQGRLSSEVRAFLWAGTDRREAFRYMGRRPGESQKKKKKRGAN